MAQGGWQVTPSEKWNFAALVGMVIMFLFLLGRFG